MKNKEILFIALLYVIFAALIFIPPVIQNTPLDFFWVIFFIIIGVAILLWIISAFIKIPENKISHLFKNHSKIMIILEIVFIILIIYEIATLQNLGITWLILFLIIVLPFFEWFFKKEE